jgi:hypothetical protein
VDCGTAGLPPELINGAGSVTPLTGVGDSGACLISELTAGGTEDAPLSGRPGAYAGKAVAPAGSVSLSRSGAHAVLVVGPAGASPSATACGAPDAVSRIVCGC